MEQNVMTVKTRYGTVDETALRAFLDDFDTSSILQAVSNLDRVAYGIGQMQEELRNLYRMSEDLMADGMNETVSGMMKNDVPTVLIKSDFPKGKSD